jgi:hypothetical protein
MTEIAETIIVYVYEHVGHATRATYAPVSATLARLNGLPGAHDDVFDLEAAINAYSADCMIEAYKLGYAIGHNPDRLLLSD